VAEGKKRKEGFYGIEYRMRAEADLLVKLEG
jgi:hypothetical protein